MTLLRTAQLMDRVGFFRFRGGGTHERLAIWADSVYLDDFSVAIYFRSVGFRT